MKKILFILFCVVLTLCFAVGCGGKLGPTSGAHTYNYSVNFSEKELEVGESVKIVAAYGDEKINYKSSDNSVATVTDAGLVTAKGVGTAYITISAESTDATMLCEIKVIKCDYTIEFISDIEYKVLVGAYKNLKVEVFRNGVIYSDNVTWSVEEDGAQIISDGNNATFTATVAGEYTVNVNTSKGATNCVKIIVISADNLA